MDYPERSRQLPCANTGSSRLVRSNFHATSSKPNPQPSGFMHQAIWVLESFWAVMDTPRTVQIFFLRRARPAWTPA
jgi:hypothetical protein